jgi:hypothetical protein
VITTRTWTDSQQGKEEKLAVINGTNGADTLVGTAMSLQRTRVGDDLILNDSGRTDQGVKLQDWFAGQNTIEYFEAANGDVLPINDGFSMFG